MIFQFITWDVDPILFTLGPISIHWYGALFSGSFLISYIWLTKLFKKEKVPVSVLDGLTTTMIFATIIGARLGHCLFYEPDRYLRNPLEILKIWEGGLASHGAAVAILIGIYIFARKTHRPFFWYVDRVAIFTAFAGVFIRTGNLMNSEIFGEVTSLPWGFYFINYYDPAMGLDPRHPTQIYEALSYLLIFVFLFNYYKKRLGKFEDGQLFGFFLIMVFGMRFLIEFLKVPQVAFEQGMTLNMGQLLSIPLILIGIAVIVYINKYSFSKK